MVTSSNRLRPGQRMRRAAKFRPENGAAMELTVDERRSLRNWRVSDAPQLVAIAGGFAHQIGEREMSHVATIGFWLGRAYWNRGHMTAIVRAQIEWLRTQRSISRIEARVYSENESSKAVLRKCGFERDGTMRRQARKDRYYDVELYALLL